MGRSLVSCFLTHSVDFNYHQAINLLLSQRSKCSSLKYSFVAINQLLKSSKLATVRAVVECGKTNLYKQQLVRLTDASPSDLRVINKFLFTKIMYCYAPQHTLQCATKKEKKTK